MKTNNILKISSVSKHHDLVQIYAPSLGLNEYKIFNFLIFLIRDKRVKDNLLKTTYQEINKFLGFKVNYQQLKNNFINISETVAELALINKQKSSYKLTDFIDSENANGIIIILFSSEFLSIVLNDKDRFCHLNFALINSFKSKYTIRLYENLIRYIPMGKKRKRGKNSYFPKLDIEVFKKLMGIENRYYKRISHLQASVIDIAVNEINTTSDIEVFYEIVKIADDYIIDIDAKFKNKSSNIVEMAFFSSNENLLNFIDIFLPKYADKKVVGFIDNKSIYFHTINKIGGKKLIINDKVGETTLDMHTSMEVLTNCYNNRKTFDWFDIEKYSLFCSKMEEKKYSEKFS